MNLGYWVMKLIQSLESSCLLFTLKKQKRKMNSLAFSHSPEGFAQRNNSLYLQKKVWLLEARLPFQWLLTLRGFQIISAGLIWRLRLKAGCSGGPPIWSHLNSQHFCGRLLPPFCGCANKGHGSLGVWGNLYLGCCHEVLWLLWNLWQKHPYPWNVVP